MTVEETLEKIDQLLQPQVIDCGNTTYSMSRPPDNQCLAEAARYLIALLREEIAERRKLEIMLMQHATDPKRHWNFP